MKSYLLRRIGSGLTTLLLVTGIVFLLTRWLPFDPVAVRLGVGTAGNAIPASVRDSLREELMLDRPVVEQYLSWLVRLGSGDLGTSWTDGQKVATKLARAFPVTAELGMIGLILAAIVALPTGIQAARLPGSFFDRSTSFGALLLFSIPAFWIAIVLIDIVVLRLRWLPLYGTSTPGLADSGSLTIFADHVRHLLLPATVLAIANFALLVRFARDAMIEQLGQDYVQSARARGIPEWRVLTRHALRNAAVPLVTLVSLIVPSLLSGSAVLERIFQWNGLGNLMFNAVAARDYPVIMALTLFGAILTIVAAMVADLLYAIVDPRVSLEEKRS